MRQGNKQKQLLVQISQATERAVIYTANLNHSF